MHKKALILAWVIVVVLYAILTNAAFSGAITVPSTDRVPLGDWSYDIMNSLASQGVVPGMPARLFQGDHLFTRIEMAQILVSMLKTAQSDTYTDKQVGLINDLVRKFRPEIASISPDALDSWDKLDLQGESGDINLTGYLQATYDKDTKGKGALVVPFRANGLMSIGENAFVYATGDNRQQRFFQRNRNDPKLDTGGLCVISDDFDLMIGEEYQNWDSSYTGSLILSDNSPGLFQIRGAGQLNLGKLLGKIKITEFTSSFSDLNTTYYLLGRRWETQLNKRLHWGISETAKTTVEPNPLAFVMPFYLYQHIFKQIDAKFNAVYATDLTYLTPNGTEIYGDLLIDDMTAPAILGGGFKRPRKTGFTLGFMLPKVFTHDKTSTVRVEYVSIDQLTYTATRDQYPGLAYTHSGSILGSPFGPNSKSFYVRLEQQFTKKTSLIGEYIAIKQATPDVELSVVGGKVLSFQIAYDIASNKSLAFRYAPYSNITPGQSSVDGNKYEIRATYSY